MGIGDFTSKRADTDVNVVGFAGHALDGILKAIKDATDATKALGNDINENAEDQERRANSERVASIASERRQRAANAAIHGKIDKGFTLMGLLQKSLEKIAGYVGDIAIRTMKSLDDSVKAQRKLILSSAQIAANQKTASRIADEVRNYGVSPNDVRKMTDALAEQGMLATDFSDKQLKLITVAMNKNNMSAEKAVKLALHSRGEEDSLIKTLIQATDLTGRKATGDVLSKIDGTMFQIYAKSAGGINQGISEINNFAKQLDHNFGKYMGAEAQTTVLDAFMKHQSGQIELVNDAEIKAALALGINPNAAPEEIIKQIQAGLQNNKFNEENVRVLRSIEGFGEEFANSLLTMQLDFNKNGNLQTKSIRSEQENIDAAKASVEGGTIGNWLSNVFTGLDDVTGGLFSGISTQLNEWFGEDASLEGVVKNGFPVIIGLLSAIVASKIIGNPLQLFAGIASLGLFKKITGFFKKGDKPEGDKPEGGAQERVRKLDEEYAAAIQKLKGLSDHIKKSAKEGFEKLKAVPDHISKSSSKAFDNIKQIGGNAFKSIKNAFKDAPNKIKDTFGTIKKRGVIAMTKIPGMFKGMGGKIGKGILGGVGIVAGALGALGATGAFDSLTPILENFTKAIAPVLTEAVNTLAPTIQSTLDLLVPIIQDVVKTLSPILDSTLKALSPILINIVETLVPIIKIIAELTTPILKVVTPILKVIGAILERVSPVIQIALKPIAWALEFISKPLQAIAKRLGLSDEPTVAAQATAAQQEALKNNDLETANNAAIVRVARANNYSVPDIQKGESAKDYFLRARKHLENEAEGYRTALSTTTPGTTEYAHASARAESFRLKELEHILKNTDASNAHQEILKLLDKAIASDKNFFDHVDHDNFYGVDVDELRELSPSSLVEQLAKFGLEDKSIIIDVVERLQGKEASKRASEYLDQAKFATGGIVTKATNAIIGEAGKEAVLPLERPEDMKRVLGNLSRYEKFKLIKALFNSNSKKLTWDLLASVMLNTLGIGTSSGPVVANDEFVKNVLQGAAKQRGKSYAEIVCNQLVETALRHAGFKTPTTGIVTKHFNHKDMRLVLNDPINGISPYDPKLVPGMILFSRPFTQAEADELNRRKGGRRKAGDPGHMGIYAGDGLWWNSTSSRNNTDYSTGKGIKVSDSRGIGVALTKPFTRGTAKLYAAGYYDGMFSASEVSSANVSKNISYEPNVNKAQGILSDAEINEILSEAGVSNSAAMKQYIEQAKQLVVNANSKDDIIAVLLEIARYLKGIAAAPANKPPMMSVARPYTPAYGT